MMQVKAINIKQFPPIARSKLGQHTYILVKTCTMFE